MFKICEKLCGPVRVMAKPGVRFIPGRAAKLCESSTGNLICDISDGYSVFGLIGNYNFVDEFSFEFDDMVELNVARMVFRTDQYVKKFEYNTGNPLYINKRGIFTVEKPFENSYCVGRVITGPREGKQWFEGLWL